MSLYCSQIHASHRHDCVNDVYLSASFSSHSRRRTDTPQQYKLLTGSGNSKRITRRLNHQTTQRKPTTASTRLHRHLPRNTLNPPSPSKLHFTSLHRPHQSINQPIHLASSRAGDVRALAALLAAGDGVARPSPVGARALGAQDVDGHGVGGDAASHALNGQASDGDAGGGGAGGRAVLVVLLDDDAVLSDLGGC